MVPNISAQKRTGKVKLVTHSITFARHELASVTAASLDAQAREGSKALQVKDEAALKDPYQRLMARNFRELNHHLWELRDSIAIVADWMQKVEEERRAAREKQR